MAGLGPRRVGILTTRLRPADTPRIVVDVRGNQGLVTWHFADARFVERKKPHSTGGDQRWDCQEQMLCFHCFLLFDFVHIHFRYGIMLSFSELTFDLERTGGILVRSAREQE